MVIRQDPFLITLDASALLAVSILLISGMHFMERFSLEFIIVTVPVLLLIRNDYMNFLKLGPGGTPPTPAGYARLMWYRLFTLRDPFSPSLPGTPPSSRPPAFSRAVHCHTARDRALSLPVSRRSGSSTSPAPSPATTS